MYLLLVNQDNYYDVYNYISIEEMLKDWGYSNISDFLAFEQKSSCIFEIYEIKIKIA